MSHRNKLTKPEDRRKERGDLGLESVDRRLEERAKEEGIFDLH
jgi:hypothetical protein